MTSPLTPALSPSEIALGERGKRETAVASIVERTGLSILDAFRLLDQYGMTGIIYREKGPENMEARVYKVGPTLRVELWDLDFGGPLPSERRYELHQWERAVAYARSLVAPWPGSQPSGDAS